jgi:hypothetical protein
LAAARPSCAIFPPGSIMAHRIPAKTAQPYRKCQAADHRPQIRDVPLLHFWRATAVEFCYQVSALTEDIPTFVAHACHPNFGEQAVEGRIGFDRWHMHFQSEYGTFQIPISQLQIHKANGKGEPIYFTDPAQPDLSVYTFDTRVLRLRTLLAAAQTRVQLNAMRSQTKYQDHRRIPGRLPRHRSGSHGIGQTDGPRACHAHSAKI